ncbi:hypothetical protein SEPCBS119000_000842 [Sporothrix epigloea]|uniref:Malate dehydrogenase n=1 Tax=Sporothrix epigloea TaxID=1892477 RepID=A0ABP0D945_9PEZI
MRASSFFLASAALATATASPAYPELTANNGMPGSLDTVSRYFDLLATKIQQARQSAAAPSLPPPSAGLVLKHVAIGRGTQNYTCDAGNATAAPVAIGALATLFNASCLAAAYPDVLDLLPRVVLQFNLTNNDITAMSTRLFPTNLKLSGHHYFKTTTTPFFNLDTPTTHIGEIPCAKNNTQKAPSVIAHDPEADNRGQGGEAAVPWLKLVAKPGVTGSLQEVYRLQTVGGSAPTTCAGMSSEFTVQYAAQYYFYGRI